MISQTARRIGHRVRNVHQGPDGLIYVLTDESDGTSFASNRPWIASRRPHHDCWVESLRRFRLVGDLVFSKTNRLPGRLRGYSSRPRIR
ncbi:MAG: PQQ-dependent sugar dehydrogenase [Desulfobacterales bacterium]